MGDLVAVCYGRLISPAEFDVVMQSLKGRSRTYRRQYLYAFPTPAYLCAETAAVTFLDGHGVGLEAINYLTQTNHLPHNVEVDLDETQQFPGDPHRTHLIIMR